MAKAQLKEQVESVLMLQATSGIVLPVRYQGQTVRIREDGVSEFNVSELAYDSQIHIRQALEAGEILKVEGDSK